ncbi:MAG: hypothetical protein K2Y39_08395 [Candidatus Obscuribacterales bacterium]|nr:hypothetical protein [Candidatus Obscuribacterales bacterium]
MDVIVKNLISGACTAQSDPSKLFRNPKTLTQPQAMYQQFLDAKPYTELHCMPSFLQRDQQWKMEFRQLYTAQTIVALNGKYLTRLRAWTTN